MDEKVIAVKLNGQIVSVGCGKDCFGVVNGNLEKDENIEALYTRLNHGKLERYLNAFDLCVFAFENDMYDEVQEK